jgi:hypothetical protein
MPQDRQGQATEPTKSAMDQARRPWPARVPSWLVGRLWLGVGHASTVRPDPSILGVVGERGSHHESCLQLVQGSARQALDLFKVRRWDALGWPLEQRSGRIVGQHDSADIGEALAQVVVLEALVGGLHVHPQPVGTFVGGAGGGPVQQLSPQALAAIGTVDGDLVGVQSRLGGLLLGPEFGLGPSVESEKRKL